MRIKVTRIHLTRSQEAGSSAVRAFADLTIGDAIAIHGVRVVEGQKGLFVSFPSDRGKDGNYYEIVHPITAEARKAIQDAVITAYERARTGPER